MSNTLLQYSRVARRQLINRVSGTGLCRAVIPFESVSSLPDPDGIYCMVVDGPGEVVSKTLRGVNVAEAYILHFVRQLPLGDDKQQARVDPELSDTRDTIMRELSNPHDTYGSGVELDAAGIGGTRMRWEPGYIEIGTKHHRSQLLTVPLIIWNAWEHTS